MGAWYCDEATAWLESLGPGDPPLDLLHPDVTMENVAEWVEPVVYSGHEGITRWWRDLSDPLEDPRIEVHEVIDQGDGTAVGVHSLTGTFRATGLPFRARWASTWRARDRLIVAIVGYRTRAEAMAAASADAER